MSNPEDCRHFEGCSAPVCPLQPAIGRHLQGERVCRLLRECVKPGGPEHVAAYVGSEIGAAVMDALPGVRTRWPDIARGLDQAARTPIKGAGKTPPWLSRAVLLSEQGPGVGVGIPPSVTKAAVHADAAR
jgi:hypothetical protein